MKAVRETTDLYHSSLESFQPFLTTACHDVMKLLPMKNLSMHGLFALLLALMGCQHDDENLKNVRGYRPLYSREANLPIIMQESRPLQRPGKIYRYGDYLLINEYNAGIHVYDNKNPQTPTPIGFIRILGNRELTIGQDILFVNHLDNLTALALDDFNSIVQISSQPLSGNYNDGLVSSIPPPPRGYYFECIEPMEGQIIGWEATTLHNPTCYATN
jgi:hypothetical protein